ncbi:MAG: hypothetical protein MUP20_04225, partial [Methyloceanibacter sp.]|nr:hypothetical protein [Methyloceanibacter sp.]
MDLYQPWTDEGIREELELSGTGRLCAEHNGLRLKAQALALALAQAIARIDLANAEGDMILSAWIGPAREAVRSLERGQ